MAQPSGMAQNFYIFNVLISGARGGDRYKSFGVFIPRCLYPCQADLRNPLITIHL